MKKLGVLDFRIGSVVVDGFTGAADVNTDALDLSAYSKAWVVYLESSHSTGTPTATIQVSRDGVNWLDYVPKSTLVSLPISILESRFYPKFMRIVYVANSSNGNITFKFNRLNE